MRLSDPKLRDLLAGEYALGTLHGAARRNFARRLGDDPGLAHQVMAWQAYLNTLAAGLEPVAPGPWVWQALEQRLGLTDDGERAAPRRPAFAVNFWRGATAAAAACALVLAVLVYQEPRSVAPTPAPVEPEVVQPEPVEVPAKLSARAATVLLTNAAQQTGWLIVQQNPNAPLVARAVSPQPLPAGKSYELWLLPEGEQPIPMGLAPEEGEVTMTPPPELAALIKPGVALAISVEPAGGSPTGLPTGPVLYQGNVVVM